MRSEIAKYCRFAAGGLRSVVIGRLPSPSSASQRYLYHTIQAIPRDFTGNRVSERDRAQGRIPTVVFVQQLLEKNPRNRPDSRKHLLTTEVKQIKHILKSVGLPFFCSTTFPLQIRAGAGSSTLLESGTVLPIKIQRDEATGKILNLVFVWADEGTNLKVNVPVVFKGEDVCPGIKKGGFLNRIRPKLSYMALVEHIPPKIEVDVSNLDIGDRVFIRDIKVHPSLELLSKSKDGLICNIKATKLANSEPAVTESTDPDPVAA